MLTMILLQAAVTTAERAHPDEFNLRPITPAKPCFETGSVNDSEVMVCGRRGSDSRYRLKPLDSSRYEPKRRAGTNLAGNLKGAAEVEQKELAPGMTSSRIMFKLKLPF